MEAGWLDFSRRPPANRAFTLVEMLAVVGIFCLLFALLMPALRSALNASRTTSCSQNLRLLSTAMLNYASDNYSWLPNSFLSTNATNDGFSWDDWLGISEYDGRRGLTMQRAEGKLFDARPTSNGLLGGEEVYICPTATSNIVGNSDRAHVRSYGMSHGGRGAGGIPRGIDGGKRLSQIIAPAKTFFLLDTWDNLPSSRTLGWYRGNAYNPMGQGDLGAIVHGGGTVSPYTFCDGHLEVLSPFDTVGTGTISATEASAGGPWTITTADD